MSNYLKNIHFLAFPWINVIRKKICFLISNYEERKKLVFITLQKIKMIDRYNLYR